MAIAEIHSVESAVSAPQPAHSRRCLILANTRAGALSKMALLAWLQARDVRSWFRPRREPDAMLMETLTELAQRAADAGLQADVEPIPERKAMPALLRAAEAEGYDAVVAAGGDGTVRAVAQGLVGSSMRLGILPVGTANNTARALGIPFDMESALQVLMQGNERSIDVGRVGDEYFLEAAGIGLFADALLAFGPAEPHAREILRLLRVCGPLCWNPCVRNLKLTIDGVEQQEEVLIVSVSNSAFVGEGWPIAPGAKMGDGLFDVVIVGAMGRWDLMRFLIHAMHGRHLQMPQVRRVRARRVEIRRVHSGHRPIPVHADDHIVGETPALLEVVPHSLRVLVPPI